MVKGEYKGFIMNSKMCTITYKKQDISTNALKKFFKNLDRHYTTIGIHKAEGQQVLNSEGFTMIKNACLQEFGTTYTIEKSRRFKSPYTGKWFYLKAGTVITIPPRVFIRIFTDKRLQKELTVKLKQIIQQNMYKSPEEVYKNLGNYARLRMKERFFGNQIKPKNKPMTVAYKGSNDPLYLTGRMASSIKSEVH